MMKHRISDILIAIVVPMLNEEKIAAATVNKILKTKQDSKYNIHIVCVDDGSTDSTWGELQLLVHQYPEVSAVRLSRNFGHDQALIAGMQSIDADAIITMDADGQHPFHYLPVIIDKWLETGCNVVNAVKKHRGSESLNYALSTKLFGLLLSNSMGQNLSNATEFKLLDRVAVKSLLACGDFHVFYRALTAWIGLQQTYIEFDVAPSMRGHSSWNFIRLSSFAINGLVAFSDLPIIILFMLGGVSLIGSLILIAKVIYAYINGAVAVGYSTLIVIQLLNLGSVLVGLGILGIYIRTIMKQTLGRPRFIVLDHIIHRSDI